MYAKVKDLLVATTNAGINTVVILSDCWIAGDVCFSPIYHNKGYYNIAWIMIMFAAFSTVVSLFFFLDNMIRGSRTEHNPSTECYVWAKSSLKPLRRGIYNGLICATHIFQWMLTLLVAQMVQYYHFGYPFIISVVWSALVFIGFMVDFSIHLLYKNPFCRTDSI